MGGGGVVVQTRGGDEEEEADGSMEGEESAAGPCGPDAVEAGEAAGRHIRVPPPDAAAAAAAGVPWSAPLSVPEPKFLGICAPAWSLCCGCALQSAVRLLAVTLGLLSSLRVIGGLLIVEDLDSGVELLFSSLSLVVAILLWLGTARLDYMLAFYALWLHGVTLAMERAVTTARLISAAKTSYERVFEALMENYRGRDPDELRSVARETVQIGTAQVIALMLTVTLVWFVIEAYVVWSWAVRVRRKELALVLYGVQPLVVPLAGPPEERVAGQYAAVYPPTRSLPPALAAALFERHQQQLRLHDQQQQRQRLDPLLDGSI